MVVRRAWPSTSSLVFDENGEAWDFSLKRMRAEAEKLIAAS